MLEVTKDPSAELDYSVDWSAWLVGGDTLAASSWAVHVAAGRPEAAAVDFTTGGSSGTFDDTMATAWVEGGLVGERYVLTNQIETAAGRIDERSIEIEIEQR